jgi:hypothetical protein
MNAEEPVSRPFDLSVGSVAEPREEEGCLAAVPVYPVDVLPSAMAELVRRGEEDGLPAALTGGAALAAAAGAIGALTGLAVSPTWRTRAIVWVSLLAPRGAGKSPAQDLAFAPLREYDEQLAIAEAVAAEADFGADGPRPVCVGDATLEALARSLHASGGAGVLDIDELATLLRGFGEYKRGGGGDRGRFLSLWTGASWSFVRVGDGRKRNGVELRIARPTLVVCGGLQPALHSLLGGEEDGLRPRWLPHLALLPEKVGRLQNSPVPFGWQTLLGRELLPHRHEPRLWTLSASGRAAFERWRGEWKRAARGAETASTAAALVKADVHVARVVLVFAELERPVSGGEVGAELVDRAARLIEFVVDCWRALPEHGGLALSRRDEVLDRAVERLRSWLEEHGGQATRRELQRAHVGGARTGPDLAALIARYEAVFPGSVYREGSIVEVRAPARKGGRTEQSPMATRAIHTGATPHVSVESGGPANGDSSLGDTPLSGQPGFPLRMDVALQRGHIVEVELRERLALDRLARKAGR